MAAQANITVFDGASTPVSHSLVGSEVFRDKDGTLRAIWKESIATVPDYAQVRVVQTRKKLPSGITRVSSRVEVPVMEAINAQNSSGYTAPPKVAYTDTVEVVGYFHERSTSTSRRLARQLALNVAGGITTTVTPVTTGPAPELLDQLISVS
jgi:hypothetical protein